MKTKTVWRYKYTARGYEEPDSDEGCFAATAATQGIRMLLANCLDRRDEGLEAFVADYTSSFSQRGRPRRRTKCTRNLTAGHRNFCWKDDVWYGRCTKPCWGCEHLRDDVRNHLSSKLKELGSSQDKRHHCSSVNEKLDGCLHQCVHVDDMLSVSPSESTKALLQNLAKDMAMR